LDAGVSSPFSLPAGYAVDQLDPILLVWANAQSVTVYWNGGNSGALAVLNPGAANINNFTEFYLQGGDGTQSVTVYAEVFIGTGTPDATQRAALLNRAQRTEEIADLAVSHGWTCAISGTVGATAGSTIPAIVGSAATNAEMLIAADTHPVARGGPVITGPSGSAGDASITHSALEGQNVLGTWTSTGPAPTLSGTDAGLLSIASGVVTLASGNLDFTAKPSYSFNVVSGASTQAVTLNVVNRHTLSNPTRSTPTSTTVAPGFTTDLGSGTARGIVIRSATQPPTPNDAQVRAGLNAAGTNAGVTQLSPLTITATGAQVFAPATVVAGGTDWPFVTVEGPVGVHSPVQVGLPHFPGTGRAVADVSVAGWTATGAPSLSAAINEDGSNRATFITGPAVSGTPSLATFELDKTYPPGTYTFSVDADMVSGAGVMRLKMFSAAGALLGTSADQALSTTATVYSLNVTVAGGTATRFGIETQAA
jgi:hypothetical protein